MSAEQETCCLCCKTYDVYHELFNDVEESNSVYEITENYFPEEMLKSKEPLECNVLCSKCWNTILDFHTFRRTIYDAHDDLTLKYNSYLTDTGNCATTEEVIISKSEFDDLVNEDEHFPSDNSMEIANTKELRAKMLQVKETQDIISKCMPDILCYICQQSYKKYSLLRNHFNEKHPALQFYVICCDKKFPIRSLLVNHLRLHLNPDLYKCDICGERKTSQRYLNNHKRKQHEKHQLNLDSDCESSSARIREENAKESRLEKVKEFEEFIQKKMPLIECHACHKTFNMFTSLQKHFKERHPLLKFYVICCERRISQRSVLAQHLRLHDKNQSVKHCDKLIDSISETDIKYAKEINVNADHSTDEIIATGDISCNDELIHLDRPNIEAENPKELNENEKEDMIAKYIPVLYCHECNQSFEKFSFLRCHFREDHPNLQFYVICCGKKFPVRHLLLSHLRLHINPELYKCDICGQCKTTQRYLNNHKLKMHGDHKSSNDSYCESTSANNIHIKEENDKELHFHFITEQSMQNSCDNDSECESTSTRNIHIKNENFNLDQLIQNSCDNTSNVEIIPKREHKLTTDDIVDEVIVSGDVLKQEEIIPLDNSAYIDTSTINSSSLIENAEESNIKKTKDKEKYDIIAKCMPDIYCYECHQSFKEFSLLRNHFKRQHPKLQFYVICCEKKFPIRSLLVSHLRLHINPELYKCDICGECKTTQRYLDNHKRIIHENRIWNYSFQVENSREARWQKIKELEDYISKTMPEICCHECQQPFNKFSLLQKHFKERHPMLQFYVMCCEKKIYQRSALAYHLRQHINPDQSIYYINELEETINQNTEVVIVGNGQLDDVLSEEDVMLDTGNCESTSTKDTSIQVENSKDSSVDKLNKENDNIIAEYMPKIQCHVCRKSFKEFGSLRIHFKEKHPSFQFYVMCCKRKFPIRSLLVRHLRLHKNPDLYKCNICGERKTTQRNLENHMRILHKIPGTSYDSDSSIEKNRIQEGNFKGPSSEKVKELEDFITENISKINCYACNKSFKKFSLLKKHFKKQHPLFQFYVNCCGRKISQRCILARHLRLHINTDEYKCVESLMCQESEQKHLHENLKPNYECQLCQKTFFYENSLKSHLLKHNDSTLGNFSCPYCPRKYILKRQLQGHIKMTHSKLLTDTKSTTSSICEHCGDVLISPYYVRKHRIMHGQIKTKPRKNYKCDICNKTLTRLESLKRHKILRHSANSTEFTSKDALMQNKTNVPAKTKRQFKCIVCAKVFRTQKDMILHMKTHTKNKLQKCPDCNEEFTRYSNMLCHRRQSHPEEFEKNRKYALRKKV